MAAMANAIGNKSLFYSKYESYKKVKKSEMKCVGKILIQLAKKAKSKSDDQKLYLKQSFNRTANPLWQYLNMLLALKSWYRYMTIYDSIEKDEVDIDSTDFELEEFKEEKLKREKKQQAREQRKIEKLEKKEKEQAKRRSKRSSIASQNLSGKAEHRRNSTRGGMPMSRDPSKRPTVVVANQDFASSDRLNLMEDELINRDKKAIQERQATIELQLLEDHTFKKPTHTLE